MKVGEVMTKDPVSIDPEAPLSTATAVMTERGFRHLPVVDDKGRLVGMVSDRDVRGAVFAPLITEYLSAAARDRLREIGKELDALRVKDVMTWDAVTVRADAPIAQAAAVMFEGRFSSLPVMADGKLVGIVTERDLLKALAATLTAVRGIDPDTYLW